MSGGKAAEFGRSGALIWRSDAGAPGVSVQSARRSSADDAAVSRQIEKGNTPSVDVVPEVVSSRLTLARESIDAYDWPFDYARALRAVPVHDQPGQSPPRAYLDSTGRWEAIIGRRVLGDEEWFELARGGWSPASALEIGALPPFAGVELGESGPAELGFIVTDVLNVRPHAGVSDTNAPVAQLVRHDAVAVLQEMQLEDGVWYRIGDGLWVSGAYLRRITWSDRPTGIGPREQWIDVNLTRQTLVAYDGDSPVYATLVSSGLPRTPTWAGLSRIWVEFQSARMTGGDRSISGDYYWLEHVPHTMYFHLDFGLHGAYWHNDFGRQKSHGCVNLSPLDARWLYDWTELSPAPGEKVARATADEPGAWVWTHY